MLSNDMHQFYSVPVFAVGEAVFSWRDVVLFTYRAGKWDTVLDGISEGLRCVALADALQDESLEDQVEAAAAEFRYDRELITAEETEGWLRDRGVTAAEWLSSVRRSVLRAQLADRLDALPISGSPAREVLEREARVDLRCWPLGRELAEECAGYAAVAAAVGALDASAAAAVTPADLPAGLDPDHARARLPLIDRILEGAARFRAGAIGAEAVAREVRLHQMEWVQLECEILTFDDASQAREAVWCLREDGLAMSEVAASAHQVPEAVRFFVEDLDPELQPGFVSAMPGDVIGPSLKDGRHMLYLVLSKTMPGVQDPAVRARAEERLFARAVAAEAQRRVRWLTEF